jgi:hypothetical protein
MRVLLAAVLLLVVGGCGGDDAEPFRIYHLETAIGRPGEEGELRCGPPRAVCPGVVAQPPPRTYRYRVRAAPSLTEKDIVPSSARRATDPETGAPLVVVAFTSRGSDAFARLTKEAARVGGRDQAWHHVAVVVGDEIVAFPQIDFDDYPDGIADAPALQITAVSDADARELVERLRGD